MRRPNRLAALCALGFTTLARAQAVPPGPNGAATPAAPAPAAAASSPGAEAAAPVPANAVRVKVLAKGSGIPLSKAEITINGEKHFSDPQGFAVFVVPPAGDGKITITKKGYENGDVPFAELRPPGEYDVRLIPGVVDDNVVVVRGTRKTAVSRKSVSIQEAAKVAPGGDAAQVVKLLPGVQESRRGEVIVRGSGPRDSRYYVDDLEVPFIFHSFGNLSIMPTPLLAAVDFESGGFGPEYGDATGGVVTLRTKSEIPERPKTEFLINIPFYSGVFHERPLSENSSISVSARRSYLDAVLRGVLSKNKDAKDAGLILSPYFGDMHATYLTKTESGHVKVSLIGAYDGIKLVAPLDASSSEDGRGSFSSFSGFVNLGVEKLDRLSKEWKYTTTPQMSYANSKNDIIGNKIDLNSQKVRVPTALTRRLGKGEELELGIDPSYQRVAVDLFLPVFHFDDPTWEFEDAEKVASKRTTSGSSVATWANTDQVFGDMTVSPGVRGYYDGSIKKGSADPRLRAKYAVSKETNLKGAVGRYSEAPQLEQSMAVYGNPDLDFQHSTHYVLGLEQAWGDDWTTEIQGFYKTAYQIVTADAATNYSNDASFRSRGFELFLRRNLTGRLFGWLSYTYSRTLERKSDRAAFHEGRYDQTHVANIVGSYKITGTDEVGGRYLYHTGDTTTTINDVVYNAGLDKYRGRTDDADRNDARLPDYNALSLYHSHDFLYDTWKLVSRLGVESWWFKPQVQGEFYNYDYSKKQSFTGIRAIPFVEVRGEL